MNIQSILIIFQDRLVKILKGFMVLRRICQSKADAKVARSILYLIVAVDRECRLRCYFDPSHLWIKDVHGKVRGRWMVGASKRSLMLLQALKTPSKTNSHGLAGLGAASLIRLEHRQQCYLCSSASKVPSSMPLYRASFLRGCEHVAE